MKLRSFLLNYYRSVLVFIVILVASLISSEEINKVSLFRFPHMDKAVHFGMYFTFSFVMVYDLFKAKTGFSFLKIYFISAIMAVSYGGFIEIAQWLFTRTRTGDFYDFLFDLAGALFAVFIWSVLKSLNKVS